MTADPDLTGALVVGLDGSGPGTLALRWALEHAHLERRHVLLVHAAGPVLDDPGPLVVDLADDDLRRVGRGQRALLRDAARLARTHAPGTQVHALVQHGSPRTVLLAAARDAEDLVVGARGHGGVASLLLGTVAAGVVREAPCPVVVVRRGGEGAAAPAGVVVGTDGTASSDPAVAFAFRVAEARSWPLTVLHCFWDASRRTGDVAHDEPGREAERHLLEDAVRAHRLRRPDVDVRLLLSRGFADRRLLEASRDHALVVVGHRRAPLLDRVVWADVAPSVVAHATGDVAVVPAPR